ncbi:hypothetical protein [uncultured Sphingomonas sp.]|uniref:hypothetical protein n=1 Tax=uncultured Sphingomonas sp. TaxID=158754 RepID=UPI0025E6A390|nr:hypothetical protein [uncultured Sphingomonas sp.]
MTRHHPSTIASPGTALPTLHVPPFTGGAATFLGYDLHSLVNTAARFHKIHLRPETSHELFDRLDYQRVNGGDLIYTDDGPKLDEDNEALFLIWRGQRS